MEKTTMPITQTDWHGFPAWELANDTIRSVIVPQFGAKIASLLDKRSGYEWMLPATLRPVRPIPYGATFTEYDMSGWDEMFPTIGVCEYPVPGAHQGAYLPDHGEVWAMEWGIESAYDALVLSIQGQALPYTLRRSARAEGDALLLDYEVRNTGSEILYYLWSAHPLFNANEHTRLILPDNVTEVVNILDNHPVLGALGTRHPFPQTDSGFRLDQVAPPASRTCRKFFAPPEETVSWAVLRQEDSGAFLRMDWDAVRTPYLGVWVDEGFYTVTSCIAVEPMTGYHDSLTTAYANNRVSSLPPGDKHTWRIKLSLGTA
jgi:galactose mutarotase-like enzyme